MSVWKSDEKLLIFASLISPPIKIIRTVTLTVATGGPDVVCVTE